MESEFVTQFVEGFNGSPFTDALTFVCFAAIPAIAVMSWVWASRRLGKNKKS
jgi:hypothetical protein